MKKIAPSKFHGEEEEEEEDVNIVLADHHSPLLNNNNLQKISCARRLNILPSSIVEENRLDHASRASSNPTLLDGDEEEIPPVVYNPTPLRWYRPPTPDFEVDLTLRLSNYVPRNSDMNNPTPVLRPDFFDGVEETLSSRLSSRRRAKGKKRAVAVADDSQKKKRSKREDNEALPLLPIERIPTLMKAVESRNGSSPIFLYGKKLEMSDVEATQNRLLMTRRERMMDYLREEEAAAVDDGGRGLKVVGVDGGGNIYHNLVLKRWPSMDGIVINSDWRKVVAANGAQKGDVVEIWGFRVDDKPCLAFNFRREN